MEQIFLAVFGLAAMYFAMGDNPLLRKWAPVVGLAGQPFWFIATIPTKQWGMVLLCTAYSLIYIKGIWSHWVNNKRIQSKHLRTERRIDDPDALLVREEIEALVRDHPYAICVMATKHITPELAEIAVRYNGWFLRFIPYNMRSLYLCQLAYNVSCDKEDRDEVVWGYIPDNIKHLIKV